MVQVWVGIWKQSGQSNHRGETSSKKRHTFQPIVVCRIKSLRQLEDGGDDGDGENYFLIDFFHGFYLHNEDRQTDRVTNSLTAYTQVCRFFQLNMAISLLASLKGDGKPPSFINSFENENITL